jgi:exopolyphosphatase/guanosine-5'-triphosphate,3'-diphosphate pyrophosphatase
MTERVAIIDLGSNAARLIIMHIYDNGAYNLVYHQKETVRLSEDMDSDKELKAPAMARAIEAMEVFAHMCQLFKVDHIIGVATAAVRNARNGEAFVDQIKKRSGIILDVISGEAEAKTGFIGVINTIDVTHGLLFDLGGASTEITLIKNRKAHKVVSLPFGAVNLTERFNLKDTVQEDQIAKLIAFLNSNLQRVSWLRNLNVPLIGVGGTARNIAKMDQKRKNYPFSKVHNYRLGRMAVDRIWSDLTRTNLVQRRKMPGLSSERADIIVAGATLVKCLFETAGSDQMIISGCGVREGLFLRHYLTENGCQEIISDILMHSSHNMLGFYKGDIPHAYKVADLAENMFDGWHALIDFGPREKSLLRVAALLHDIGIAVNYYDHARHSAYLVENARLFGLTHREQMLVAVIAGWHNGPISRFSRYIYGLFLDESDWQIATKLSLLLALAESLDITQLDHIKSVQTSMHGKQAILRLITENTASIERQEILKHRKWFKKVFGIDLIVV